MSVRIITGNIGSGKTEFCIDEIEKKHNAMPTHRCIMLVPSHYSHETEKMIIDRFGGSGINNIEVTSFEKLAKELLKGTEKRLAPPGKQVLICRAVEECVKELNKRHEEFDSRLVLSVSKDGFLDVAQSLISEMHRYTVTGEQIREKIIDEPDGILKQKLTIASMISDNYNRFLSDTNYIDSDEDLVRLAEKIGGYFSDNTSIWIDKFDEFLPQQMQVVTALIDSGADITITFNTSDEYENTYYGTVSAIEKIKNHCPVSFTRLDGGMNHIKSDDLKFLFSTWFGRETYDLPVHNAEVFEARDSYTEIEHIAGRILDFVREEKYRFRDISLICGNFESYSHIIKAVFDEYEIPYYSDESFSIADHPIAMQILSLFDVIENNWDYASVFEYLRAGFIYLKSEGKSGRVKYNRIPLDDIDKLENHVLKFGIRGRNMWNTVWNKGQENIIDTAFGRTSDKDTDEISSLDCLRKAISEPIEIYSTSTKQAKTAKDFCCALYEFLENINLYAGLKSELLAMAMNNATSDAQRFGQIWNLILDILDQINTAIGEHEITQAEFFTYMRAAMTQCSIRTIPSGVDRVYVGTVEKNQAINSAVIFAAGAVSGTFPSETAIEGFLSNADRERLCEMDIVLSPTTSKKNEKQYNNVYKTLSSVTDKLCISYPVQTPDGKTCRPSRTVLDICSKLTQIRIYNDISLSDEEIKQMYISTPKATLHKMLINNKRHPLWSHVNAWFTEHKEWKNQLLTISKARRDFSFREISLNPKLSADLYKGQIMYSATRLNSYAECPFRYFLQYGLKARERDEWELNAADTGSYAHEVIRRFCERIDSDENLSWAQIDDITCTEIVDEIVNETISHLDSDDLKEKERTKSIFMRMGKTVKEAAKAVRESVVSGEFLPLAYEKDINISFTENVGIKGTIDRLDVCRHDGINEYRIIDYKTGSKDFKVADIYNRCDMQPVIYALVLRMLDDKAKISGMYYSKVRNDFASIKSNSKQSTALTQLRKNTELTGATFVDTDKDGNIEPQSADRIETEFTRINSPMIFKKGVVQLGGNVRTHKCGERLMETVRDNVINMDREIRGGNIEIAPLNNGGGFNDGISSCKYCPYSPACKFDEDIRTQREINEHDSEIWAMLEGDE